MTRVGLKLLLAFEIISGLQQAVAANPSDGNAEAIPQNPPTVVTNVAQLRTLTRADFNRGRPVSLTGTVTLVDSERRRLVLQDATGAMMWCSDKPIDTGLAGKMVRLDCSNAWTYAVTFPDFPDKPSGTDVQTSFEAPSNWGNYHLTRMAAHLHPPRSGEYTFWIASDDSSELWLSTDDGPTRVRKMASVMEGLWTDPHEWDRFPSQRSETVYLQSDKSYYIEAFQEQGLQNDHLSVAWEGPGIARSVIPGECLTPWADNERGSWGKTDATNGVLREYWTNYAVGSVVPITPGGPAGATLTGREASFQVLGVGTQPEPQTVDLAELLAAENNYRWIQTEGTITFANTDGEGATLELAAGTRRASVRIAKWNQSPLQAGQNWRVRVEGVCEGVADAYEALNVGFIWVPSAENVHLLKAVSDSKEAIVPPGSTPDSTPGFGGYYTGRGAVTFDGRFSGRRYLYVQDIHGSVSVSDADRVFKDLFEVGQWVQVGGTLSPGKAGLQLVPMTIRLLGWQSLPLPAEPGEDAAFRDGQWTEMEGVVRSIRPDGVLKVKGPGGFMSVWSPTIRADEFLVDSTVRFRGVVSLDAMGGPLLLVGSRQFIEIEEKGSKDPFALPSQRIGELDNLPIAAAHVHRVKVEGVVTYADANAVYLQDGSGAVRFQAAHAGNFHPGDHFQVVGFPDASGSLRVLAEPELRVAGVGSEVKASEVNLNDGFADNINGNLVEVHGNLLAAKNRGPVQVLELQSGQRVFEAVLAENKGQLPVLATGSLLKIIGVCIADLIPAPGAKSANWESSSMASFQILLRTPADIIVQRGPPWWTTRKVAALISFLLVVLGGTLLWMRLQGRRYERRQLAQLEFSRQILKSQETERHRIAANLHDSLGQNLLVIKNLAVLAMQPAPDKRATFERLDTISGMASQVIEEVRQITHDLRPYQLERVGLTQTLRGTIRRVSENCPIEFASHVDDVDGLFDNDREIHIYRILQEALNNIVKHSEATEATVVVRKEADSIVMIVRDNGRGFDAMGDGTELSRAGFGLSGIDERARILRGKALFDSRPGQGFRLTVEIPLTRQV